MKCVCNLRVGVCSFGEIVNDLNNGAQEKGLWSLGESASDLWAGVYGHMMVPLTSGMVSMTSGRVSMTSGSVYVTSEREKLISERVSMTFTKGSGTSRLVPATRKRLPSGIVECVHMTRGGCI